jgi:hypothetical protein
VVAGVLRGRRFATCGMGRLQTCPHGEVPESAGRESDLGRVVVNGCSGFRGLGRPNGPPSAPARAGGLLWALQSLLCGQVNPTVAAGVPRGCRRSPWLQVFPVAAGLQPAEWVGLQTSPHGEVPESASHEPDLGRVVVNGWTGLRGPGRPNGPPSAPARAGGLLLAVGSDRPGEDLRNRSLRPAARWAAGGCRGPARGRGRRACRRPPRRRRGPRAP